MRALKPPTSMSWGNLCNHIHPPDLHRLAKACSASSTTHFMQGAKWVDDTKGASIFDFSTERSLADCLQDSEDSSFVSATLRGSTATSMANTERPLADCVQECITSKVMSATLNGRPVMANTPEMEALRYQRLKIIDDALQVLPCCTFGDFQGALLDSSCKCFGNDRSMLYRVFWERSIIADISHQHQVHTPAHICTIVLLLTDGWCWREL